MKVITIFVEIVKINIIIFLHFPFLKRQRSSNFSAIYVTVLNTSLRAVLSSSFMFSPSLFLQNPKIEISLFYLLREVGLVVS
nr:MAG TPA: hypothetical protein [Caudoviricetes sp.]